MLSLLKSFLVFCLFSMKASYRFKIMFSSFICLNLLPSPLQSAFQERSKDFGGLHSARNTDSVAEEQEEMRRVFAVGCGCPKLSGTVITVTFPEEVAER